MKDNCKIVMYHYVRPLKNSECPEIKGLELESFIRQIKYFENNFNFITVEQMLNSIYHNYRIPRNSIALTFDDGFKDHYKHVFPILKKGQIQGLFFPPGKVIEENVVLDVHKIHFILASCDNKQNIINEINNFVKEHMDEFELESPEYYYKKWAIPNRYDPKEVGFIKTMLQRELHEKLRRKLTDELFKKFVTKDEEVFAKDLYLSMDEIAEMVEEGMYFGSHSYSHEWLGHMDLNDLDEELDKSMEFHSKICNDKGSWIMCYPYGNFSKNVIEKIKDQGYRAGLTTEVGDAVLDDSEPFMLKRFDTNDFPK